MGMGRLLSLASRGPFRGKKLGALCRCWVVCRFQPVGRRWVVVGASSLSLLESLLHLVPTQTVCQGRF